MDFSDLFPFWNQLTAARQEKLTDEKALEALE